MAFQVTPETDVAEAAMFHGAAMEMSTDQAVTTIADVEFDTVLFDTDGFCDAANYRFVIPEGVEFIRAGMTSVVDGSTNGGINCFIDVAGLRVAATTNIAHSSGTLIRINLQGPVVPVSAGDAVKFRAAAITTCTIKNKNFEPNRFWIEAIKTPFGRPDSPTLP